MTKSKKPSIRFKSFTDDYQAVRVEDILTRYLAPVDVKNNEEYRQIGIRSHGKGIFHKEATTKKDIGNKRVFWVKPDLFILNIVFAWERAVAKTTVREEGLIASHRFPMYEVDKEKASLDYVLNYFLTQKGQRLLELASPGGAGRNKTLGQKEFERLVLKIPSFNEQVLVESVILSINDLLGKLKTKHDLLFDYKKGCSQKLFSQSIRFKNDDKPYPNWVEKKVGDIMTESRIKGSSGKYAKKITVKLWGKGVFEKSDKKQGSENTQYYKRKAGQFIYSKLDFLNCAFGIVPECLDGFETTVDLPCFDIAEGINHKFILEYIKQRRFYERYGDQADGTRKAKRIHADTFLSFPVQMPVKSEQDKIASFLENLDRQISNVSQQIDHVQTFKNGLLQQMFV
ncbi:type I restriction enzyme, S subunit [Vibrio crassostreae]|nr:type I restriction enzyme, S subunit [Vibrio crassostreae]CAK4026774.1 type I restriction enzyme, S subunit [Vibrio crassostreae]